jgi:hypothetical protein
LLVEGRIIGEQDTLRPAHEVAESTADATPSVLTQMRAIEHVRSI